LLSGKMVMAKDKAPVEPVIEDEPNVVPEAQGTITATEPVEPVSEESVEPAPVTFTEADVEQAMEAVSQTVKEIIKASVEPTAVPAKPDTDESVEPTSETPPTGTIVEATPEQETVTEESAKQTGPSVSETVVEVPVTVYKTTKTTRKPRKGVQLPPGDGIPQSLRNGDILVLEESPLSEAETKVLTDKIVQYTKQLENKRNSKNLHSELSGKVYVFAHRLQGDKARTSELKKQHRAEMVAQYGDKEAGNRFNWSAIERGMTKADHEVIKLLADADKIAAKLDQAELDGAGKTK